MTAVQPLTTEPDLRAGSMTIDVHVPDGEFGAESWHKELVEFRGEVLHGLGLPSSGDHDGHDEVAYHLIARLPTGEIVGAARFAPLENLDPSWVLDVEPQAGDLLDQQGLTPEDVVEGGRWLVAAPHRHSGVGRSLILSGASVTLRLGRKLVWVLAGTAHGQDILLTRMGFHPASDKIHPMPGLGYPVRLLTARTAALLDAQETGPRPEGISGAEDSRSPARNHLKGQPQ
ncbi:GNAT family N-acyltransferase [Herbidospora sp. RD11066]